MLELNTVRQKTKEVIERLKIKNFHRAEEIITHLLDLDKQKRGLQKEMEDMKAELNVLSKEIGKYMQEKSLDLANKAKEKVAQIKSKSKEFEENVVVLEQKIEETLLSIPNLPHSSVPTGHSAEDNEIVFSKDIENLEKELPHWELATKYDIIDFELGNKITGAGFPLYKGKGAKLQRALINFFLDEAIQNGFSEVQPPLMVNEDSARATGQLPDKEGQMYHITLDNFYMIPTAEVPVTNIFRNEIVKKEDLPLCRCAYSQCFRREAGSYGKDVRGLNRLHQFDKVEIVCIDTKEHSYIQLEKMKEHVSNLLTKLELPYRILRLCGGDISFTSALTFDFETYSAGQKRWLEVSSVSNFETYQANRLKVRLKNDDGKTELCHTLNGSALALPRIVATLLENNQTEKGILIPKALQPYTGFDIID